MKLRFAKNTVQVLRFNELLIFIYNSKRQVSILLFLLNFYYIHISFLDRVCINAPTYIFFIL